MKVGALIEALEQLNRDHEVLVQAGPDQVTDQFRLAVGRVIKGFEGSRHVVLAPTEGPWVGDLELKIQKPGVDEEGSAHFSQAYLDKCKLDDDSED